MNRTLRRAAVVASLSLAAGAPSAQPGPLRSACPGVDEQLQTALFKTVRDDGSAALLNVSVKLQGQRVLSVDTEGGPPRYHSAVRKALLALRCSSDGDAAQTVRFTISFIDPWGRADGGAHMAQARH